MEEDISHAARLGAAGVVVGALSPDGTIDMPCTSRMVQVARSQVRLSAGRMVGW